MNHGIMKQYKCLNWWRLKEFLIPVTILFILFSCTEDPKSNETEVVEETPFDIVSYNYITVEEQDEECAGTEEPCTKVVIKYPDITSNSVILTSKKLDSIIKNKILDGALKSNTPHKEIQGACQQFINDFKSFERQVSDGIPAWAIDIDVRIINNDEHFFSFSVNEYAYTGGAHPNQQKLFFNYDIRNGNLLTLEELVGDLEKLTAIAEVHFRKSKKLSPTENLNSAGYTFENGKFSLGKNFGLEKGNLIIYYNSYEIAPYVMGPTALSIPLSEVL